MTTIYRRLELLARALKMTDTTKYQAEQAGESLLAIAKEVKELEGSLEEAPAEASEAAVARASEAATEWLRRNYTAAELKEAYLDEPDHGRKWLPVKD